MKIIILTPHIPLKLQPYWVSLSTFKNIRSFKLCDVQDLFVEEAVNSFSAEDWWTCVEHAKTEINCDWWNEGLDDVSVQEMVTNLWRPASQAGEWQRFVEVGALPPEQAEMHNWKMHSYLIHKVEKLILRSAFKKGRKVIIQFNF